MTRITRRRALQLSTGGLAAFFATGRAPAFAQGTTLHWLRCVDYVPVSDQLIRGKINEQCQKGARHQDQPRGRERADGVQARITSAVQSGSGPDIMIAINNWAQLYAESVVDVSDVAEEIGKAQGDYYETAKAVAYDGSKWLAVPYTILGAQFVNRSSWLRRNSASTPKNFRRTGRNSARPERS